MYFKIYWLVLLKWVSSVLDESSWCRGEVSPSSSCTHFCLTGTPWVPLSAAPSPEFVGRPRDTGVLFNFEVTLGGRACLSPRLWHRESLSARYWSKVLGPEDNTLERVAAALCVLAWAWRLGAEAAPSPMLPPQHLFLPLRLTAPVGTCFFSALFI